jgi:hypothetical protein
MGEHGMITGITRTRAKSRLGDASRRVLRVAWYSGKEKTQSLYYAARNTVGLRSGDERDEEIEKHVAWLVTIDDAACGSSFRGLKTGKRVCATQGE